MDSWRQTSQETTTKEIIKESIQEALSKSRLVHTLSKDDKKIMKEHKLTEAEVYHMMDEGKWDDFKGWAGKKAKAAGKAAKDIATADVGDLARTGASAVKSTAKAAKKAAKSAKDYAKEKGVKGMASDAKGHAKDALAKLDRVWQGAKEIGVGGAEATNLGGEETFDIEKRKAAKDKGETELEGSLRKVGYEPLSNLFNQLLKMDWPNFKGKSRQRKTTPEPVDLKEGRTEDFAKGMKMIKDVYDQIVAEFNQSEKTKEDAATANARISAARDLALYFMDYVLADRGSYLKEAEEGAVSKNYQSVYAAKLPLGLAVAGTALLASGLNMEDKFVQNAIKKAPENLDGMSQELADNLSKGIDVRTGEGWTQAMQRATSINMAPDAPIGNLLDPKVQDLSDVIGDSFTNPEGRATMEEVFKLAENEPDMTFADLFKRQSALSGRGDSIGDLLPIKPGSFFRNLTDTAVKATVNKAKMKGGEKLVKAAASSALGPILSGLGIAALGGGAASALMRAKGKYGGSQMASLQKLVDGFKDVKVGEKEEVPVPPVVPPKTGETPKIKGPETTEPQVTNPQTTGPQTTGPQTTGPQTTNPQKDKDVKAKSGPAVPVFKPGPRPGTSGAAALQKDLVDIDLPNWASHFITKAVAGQMRASGFKVQEGFVTNLDEFTLPFSSQAKIEKFLKELPPETPPETKEKVVQAVEKSAEKAAKSKPNDSEEAAEDATDQIISKAADQLNVSASGTDEQPPQPVPGEEEPEEPQQEKPQSTEPFMFNLSWIKTALVKKNEEVKTILQKKEKTLNGKDIARLKSMLIPDKKISLAVSAVERFVQAYNVKLSSQAPRGVDGLAPDPTKTQGRTKMGSPKPRLPESVQRRWKHLAGIK